VHLSYHNLPNFEGFKSKEVKKVRELAADHAQKVAEWRSQKRRHEEARAAVASAMEQDKRHRAEAVRGGKADPGKPAEERARTALAEVEDRAAVLEVVIADIEADLGKAITVAKGPLLREARARREEAHKEYAAAVAALREIHDRFNEAGGLVRWAHSPTSHYTSLPANSAVLSVPAELDRRDPEDPAEGTVRLVG
jgi:hypothetical protein